MADEPLFWIHLNVDYPFNLTGVLYFPKIKNNIEMQRNKIQLYCNQVFVTDAAVSYTHLDVYKRQLPMVLPIVVTKAVSTLTTNIMGKATNNWKSR